MASATASATPKTDKDIIKDLLNEIMEKVDALTDKGRIWSVWLIKVVGFKPGDSKV